MYGYPSDIKIDLIDEDTYIINLLFIVEKNSKFILEEEEETITPKQLLEMMEKINLLLKRKNKLPEKIEKKVKVINLKRKITFK